MVSINGPSRRSSTWLRPLRKDWTHALGMESYRGWKDAPAVGLDRRWLVRFVDEIVNVLHRQGGDLAGAYVGSSAASRGWILVVDPRM